MIEQIAPTQRVTCEAIGRPKLLAEITPTGIHVWCKICKASHFIERARVMRAWERGESVQCSVAPDEPRV